MAQTTGTVTEHQRASWEWRRQWSKHHGRLWVGMRCYLPMIAHPMASVRWFWEVAVPLGFAGPGAIAQVLVREPVRSRLHTFHHRCNAELRANDIEAAIQLEKEIMCV